MYAPGLDRDSGSPIFVAKSHSQRKAQRQVLEEITLRRQNPPPKKRPLPKGGRC